MSGNGIKNGRRSGIKKSFLKIKEIADGSPFADSGIKPGDRISEINGKPIRDVIDFRFHSADEKLDCVFLRNELKIPVSIRMDENGGTGLVFEPMRFLNCGNRCAFCFIDQNPKGLRKSLYLKDEDYRLSFLYGNYVTLTRVTQADLERIVEQRLSPLYVSIHATDPAVRNQLLGLKKDDRLLGKIRFLASHGIEMHGQIVLCPGINDGDILLQTVTDLSAFYPNLKSLAVVPVGLTKHRTGLPDLNPVTKADAQAVIRMIGKMQRRFLRSYKSPFVFLADELYLTAGKKLPPALHYGAFWQIDNGIGMTRSFLNDFDRASKSLPSKSSNSLRMVFVTGELAGPVLKKYLIPRLNRIRNLFAGVIVVKNQFYGETVTVSGLLSGRDILTACREIEEETAILIPSNCLNADGLFLDDLSVSDLKDELNRDIVIVAAIEQVVERICIDK